MHGSRDRILDAAFDLFAQRGYTAVSTGDIARRAQVNESTLFRNFKSKEAVAKAVMKKKVDRDYGRVVAEAVSKSPDLETCVKIATSYYVHAFNAKFVRFQVAMALKLPRALAFRSSEVRRAFVKCINEHQNKNNLRRVDPVNAERMLACAIYGLAVVKAFKLDQLRTPTVEDALSFRDIWLQGMLQ